jgi:flagellar basal body-associated protein FliL
VTIWNFEGSSCGLVVVVVVVIVVIVVVVVVAAAAAAAMAVEVWQNFSVGSEKSYRNSHQYSQNSDKGSNQVPSEYV